MENLTPAFFDTIIIVIMIIGLALAGVRYSRTPAPPPRKEPLP